MQDFIDFLQAMWTNQPLICIIGAILISMLLQAGLSAFVLSRRRITLKEEYGYTDGQIALFYWKSVLLFPLTWFLLVKQGINVIIRKIKRT